MARRDPPKPTSQDVAQMSQHRCNVQALVDAMVNAVMRGGLPTYGGETSAFEPSIGENDEKCKEMFIVNDC